MSFDFGTLTGPTEVKPAGVRELMRWRKETNIRPPDRMDVLIWTVNDGFDDPPVNWTEADPMIVRCYPEFSPNVHPQFYYHGLFTQVHPIGQHLGQWEVVLASEHAGDDAFLDQSRPMVTIRYSNPGRLTYLDFQGFVARLLAAEPRWWNLLLGYYISAPYGSPPAPGEFDDPPNDIFGRQRHRLRGGKDYNAWMYDTDADGMLQVNTFLWGALSVDLQMIWEDEQPLARFNASRLGISFDGIEEIANNPWTVVQEPSTQVPEKQLNERDRAEYIQAIEQLLLGRTFFLRRADVRHLHQQVFNGEWPGDGYQDGYIVGDNMRCFSEWGTLPYTPVGGGGSGFAYWQIYVTVFDDDNYLVNVMLLTDWTALQQWFLEPNRWFRVVMSGRVQGNLLGPGKKLVPSMVVGSNESHLPNGDQFLMHGIEFFEFVNWTGQKTELHFRTDAPRGLASIAGPQASLTNVQIGPAAEFDPDIGLRIVDSAVGEYIADDRGREVPGGQAQLDWVTLFPPIFDGTQRRLVNVELAAKRGGAPDEFYYQRLAIVWTQRAKWSTRGQSKPTIPDNVPDGWLSPIYVVNEDRPATLVMDVSNTDAAVVIPVSIRGANSSPPRVPCGDVLHVEGRELNADLAIWMPRPELRVIDNQASEGFVRGQVYPDGLSVGGWAIESQSWALTVKSNRADVGVGGAGLQEFTAVVPNDAELVSVPVHVDSDAALGSVRFSVEMILDQASAPGTQTEEVQPNLIEPGQVQGQVTSAPLLPWDPGRYPGWSGNWDSSDEATVTLVDDGGNERVSSIADLGPSGQPYQHTNPDRYPYYARNEVNGRNCLRFNVGGQWHALRGPYLELILAPSDWTVFVVFKPDPGPQAQEASVWGDGDKNLSLEFRDAGETIALRHKSRTYGWQWIEHAVDSSAPPIYVAAMAQTSPDVVMRLNGGAWGTIQADRIDNMTQGVTLVGNAFAATAGVDEAFAGLICEWITYRQRLTDEQIAEIELGLAQRWGIALQP